MSPGLACVKHVAMASLLEIAASLDLMDGTAPYSRRESKDAETAGRKRRLYFMPP